MIQFSIDVTMLESHILGQNLLKSSGLWIMLESPLKTIQKMKYSDLHTNEGKDITSGKF